MSQTEPGDREEMLLQGILNGDTETNIEPGSRKEAYLKAILEKGTLPGVSVSDNGKVLSVVNGEWGATNIPEGNLPAVTSADNGRFLRVSDGSWGNDEFPEFDKVRKNTYNIKVDILTAAFIKANGTIQGNASYRTTGLIPVKDGDTFSYKLSHGSSVLPIIAFYATSGAHDSTGDVMGVAEDYKSGTYEAPDDGFVRFVYHTSYPDVYVNFTSEIPSNVADITNALGAEIDANAKTAEVDTDDVFKKVYSIKSNESAGWIDSTGAEKSTGNYKRTDFITVKQGETISYRLSHGTADAPMIAVYDETKTYKPSRSVVWTSGATYRTGTYTVPADGYVRFVHLGAYDDVYAIFTSEIPDNVRLYVNDRFRVERVWGLNVLLLGDSIFGNDGEIPAFIGEYCGSCVNGAFGGTRVSARDDDPNWKYFDGENIVTALTTGTWTNQDAAASALSSSYPWITGRLAGLKAVDMSTVDVIIMDWGTNDYTAAQTIQTITEAYGSVIDKLQSAFPSVRLLISTPIWRYFSNSENGDNKTYTPATCTLKEIAAAIEEFAGDKRISVLNAYRNMPLSYATASTYFDTGDKTHLNTAGNRVYAGLLTGKLKTMF